MTSQTKIKRLPKGIRLKPNGHYIADICINGIRKTTTCKTYEEAIDAQYFLRKELQNNKNINDNRSLEMRQNQKQEKEFWTLKQACDYCMKTKWINSRNKSAVQTKVNHMRKYFGDDININDITTKKIDEYINYFLQRNLKQGSINGYIAGLSTVLHVAFDRDMLTKIPKIALLKDPSNRIRFLSDEEEDRILKYFDKDKEMHDILVVLLDTGMRINELLKMKKCDVDINTELISIWENKTDHPRSVPMTKRVKKIIEMRINQVRPLQTKKYSRSDTLFDLNYTGVSYRWKKMRKDLGYKDDPYFVIHVLRHTCCSRLIQKGINMAVAKVWMGHKNINTTLLYAHLAPNNLVEAKNMLEK